jgi:hypothetical protein
VGSAAREIWAAAGALGAYLTTVLPRARRELRRLGPLPPEKQRNAEAVAVFATLAPRPRRAAAVRAIVALQAAIDLRDAAEEAGRGDDPQLVGRIARLDERWRDEVRELPAYEAVQAFLDTAVERCEHGQIQTHRAAREGPEPLRRWVEDLEPGHPSNWWEVAAGATSSVEAHALIAAAADPATTIVHTALIFQAYQPAIAALTVFLDDLVDREADRTAGEHSYLAYYESGEEAAESLALLAQEGNMDLGILPHADRHRAILAGVAGYYLSSPAAETEYAQPIRERLLAALGPSARLLAGFSRLRRLGQRKWPGQVGNSPGP